MVYSYLSGRIGNNLFQIAAGAALAFRNKTSFTGCITETWCAEPDNCYLDKYLVQFENNLLRKVKLVKGTPPDALVFNEVRDPSKIAYYDRICLHGLWQSENYFVNEKDFIRDLFSIDEETGRVIKDEYKEAFSAEIISIVVRRGDYCKQPQFHPTCSLKYYMDAIDYFGRDKRYLIISDDIEWCKERFRGSNFYFTGKTNPLIDLYLQTFSTHNIISNSTFAWWGAWLNKNPEKKIIAPGTNWYGYFYKEFYRSDMLPPEWIRMKNPLSLNHRIIVFAAILINMILPAKHAFEKALGIKIKLRK